MSESPRIGRVLVRGANWVGDAVMTIPALREIRRLFPGAHITLWTRPALRGVFQGVEFIDEFLTPETTSLTSMVRSLRAGKFQLAILFQNAFRAAFLVWAARIPIRCGYRTDGRGFLLTHPVKVDGRRRQHQIFSYLELVAALERALTGNTTVDFATPDMSLFVSPERRERARAFLVERGVERDKALVIINPGATNSRAKRWFPERFAALADRLLERGDVSVAFIGSGDERSLAERIVAHMRRRPVVLTGQTDLERLVEIISCAQVLVSNDTGPAHIGAAVGVPTLVLFGPTQHEVTRPFSERALVIRHPVFCSPCMRRDCPIDHRCMAAITVDEVYRRVADVLDAEISMPVEVASR